MAKELTMHNSNPVVRQDRAGDTIWIKVSTWKMMHFGQEWPADGGAWLHAPGR